MDAHRGCPRKRWAVSRQGGGKCQGRGQNSSWPPSEATIQTSMMGVKIIFHMPLQDVAFSQVTSVTKRLQIIFDSLAALTPGNNVVDM